MLFGFELDITLAIGLFILSTIFIAVGGTSLTRQADKLADLTGFGEAMVGAILLGAITSLSGIVTSVTAAYEGHPQLSVSNAIGGIAAQTVFLAIADITYRKANLEHAAASMPNIMQTLLLIAILVLVLLSGDLPSLSLFHIHPTSFIIILLYILGQRMVSKSKSHPMWQAVETKETKRDVPDEKNITENDLATVSLKFILFGAVIAVSGYVLAQSAIVISGTTGLSEGVMGALFTAVASSLPELIVSVSAVRQGALTLAVSNVIGGNTFDVLFVSFSDMAYTEGSIYHTLQTSQRFTIYLTLLLTAILALGLIYREKKGFAKIGWESVLMIAVFLAGYAILFFI
ncbi:MAG: sodium:calcium antiporter [Fulvivirga sp.]|nr:sodium:calcium antiporter [Fulvivirga sp.]